MPYLVAFLLLILILALILLILPVEDRKQLLRLLLREREGTPGESAPQQAEGQPILRGPPQEGQAAAAGKSAPPTGSAPEEVEGPPILRGPPQEGQATAAGPTTWARRIWERFLRPLRPQPKAPPVEGPPSAPASLVRMRLLLLAFAILVAALGIGRFLERRLAPRQEGQLAVLVGTIAPRGPASQELAAFLRKAFEEAGLGNRVSIRTERANPADAPGASELLQRKRADVLLWGEESGSPVPRYSLRLALCPHENRAVPEFEEYFHTLATPPLFPLGTTGEDEGLSQEQVASLLVWLARFYLGEFDRVESAVPQLPEGANEVIRFHQGALRWLSGDYPGARSAFESLVSRSFVTTLDGAISETYTCPPQMSPSSCAALQNDLAATLLTQESLGQVPPTTLDEAIALLESAVQTEDRPLYRYNLGRAYMARSRADLALPHLDKAVEQDPGNAAALALLSMACTATGETGRARTMANRAMQADRSLADGALALGLHLLSQGDLKGSER
ncbi:MAG: tetratricopeptide repeat protein, partial [Chloroflexia bacterium]